MSGHSKWASIRHKKGKEDAKRGKLFTKSIKEITVAAKIGGGDADMNPRLRQAIVAAKGVNMPADNIERAIKRGTGDLEGVNYEDVIYEGFGPDGIALLVETTTDNRNRTFSEIKHLFGRCGGNLGAAGCVSWMFDRKGLILIANKNVDEETLFDAVLDAGADDMTLEGDTYEIITEPEVFEEVREAIAKMGLEPVSAEITKIPQTTVPLEMSNAKKALNIVDKLEDHDDVTHVYANFDIPDDILSQLE